MRILGNFCFFILSRLFPTIFNTIFISSNLAFLLSINKSVDKKGKKFESYIGWSFSRELKCERYLLSVGFSLKEEKNLITDLIERNNIKIRELIITNLDKYLKSLSSSDKKLSQSESKSDKSKKTSSDNSNMKNKSKNNNININKDKKDKDEKKN